MQTTANKTVDRAELRLEIERTREAFLALVASLPEAEWSNPVVGSKWTGRQLLHHVTWALEQLPKELESAARGKGMFNYPGFIANAGSYWLVKWEARQQTRESIATRYGEAVDRVLGCLETAKDDDWTRGARFYGERFYSVADLYHTPANHFQEHCAALVP